MPSSYSGNLLLELMADGENDGLWGDITNENLEILGRAISGVTTVALAGTTHTLTVTQGTLSEGHFMVLELGGSPTGTNTITIDPNTVERLYLVKNGSGQDAVFTQGSGGNVTVPNGANAIIYCDGAGSGAKVTDFTSNLLRSSNNLSDLGDAATALTNLGLTATAAELNTLDGVTSTTGELNLLDGVTWTLTDYNSLTATAAELNVLDGVTWTLTDYNSLTATATELNVLDGITASTAELNKLDGLTATTTELNYVDGVTSAIQTQLDAKYEAATQSEATWKAGTSTIESLVSPAKVKAANTEFRDNNDIGWDQTWQDVSGVRSLNVSVQNTYGKPIMVYLQGSRANRVEVSTDDSTWVDFGRLGTPGAFSESVSFILPVGHYYIVRSASGSPSVWVELR